MKQSALHPIFKIALLLVLMSGMVLMAGCGTEKWTTSDDKQKPQSEEQTQDQTDDSMEDLTFSGFYTRDIYGNDVNQDIFKDYKLTLVNVWGTFCGPCLEEMPSLGELQNEFEPKGVNIAGVVVDVQNEEMEVIDEQIQLAREIAETTGADYTHLIISNDMIPVMNQFDAIPASFFVDSEGNIVSEFYIGSRSKEDWVDVIETNLEKLQ